MIEELTKKSIGYEWAKVQFKELNGAVELNKIKKIRGMTALTSYS